MKWSKTSQTLLLVSHLVGFFIELSVTGIMTEELCSYSTREGFFVLTAARKQRFTQHVFVLFSPVFSRVRTTTTDVITSTSLGMKPN